MFLTTVFASSTFIPLRSGISTCEGPLDTDRMTLSPFCFVAFSSGLCLKTTLAFTSLLLKYISVKVSPSLVRISSASLTSIPITKGTVAVVTTLRNIAVMPKYSPVTSKSPRSTVVTAVLVFRLFSFPMRFLPVSGLALMLSSLIWGFGC